MVFHILPSQRHANKCEGHGRKAVSQSIIQGRIQSNIVELENGLKLKKGLAYAAHKHFHHELFGSRVRSKKRAALPEGFPLSLRDILTAKAATWKGMYPQVCSKCAKPEWIKPGHLPPIMGNTKCSWRKPITFAE